EVGGRRLFSQVREAGPIMDTLGMVKPVALGELAMDPPDPLPYLTAHSLIDELPASAINALITAAGPDSQLSILQFLHMGGALARRSPDAGARATLPGNISMLALGILPDESSVPAVERSLRGVEEILAPNEVGLYPNFVE